MPMRADRNQTGFTLTEVVVAMSIASLVAAGAWILLSSMTGNWVQARSKSRLVAEANLLKNLMLNGRGPETGASPSISGLREAFSFTVSGGNLYLNGYCGETRYYEFDTEEFEMRYHANTINPAASVHETLVANTLGVLNENSVFVHLPGTRSDDGATIYLPENYYTRQYGYRYRVESVSYSNCTECEEVDIEITLRDQHEQYYTLAFTASARKTVNGQCTLDAECSPGYSCLNGCCQSLTGAACNPENIHDDCDDGKIETIDICQDSSDGQNARCIYNASDKIENFIQDNALWGTGGWETLRALLGPGNQTLTTSTLLATPGFTTQAAVYAPPLNEHKLLDLPASRMPDYNTHCLACHTNANWTTNPHGGGLGGATSAAPCAAGGCAQGDYCGYPLGRGKNRYLHHPGLTLKQVHTSAKTNNREFYRTEDMQAGVNYVLSCVDCHVTNHSAYPPERHMLRDTINGKAMTYPLDYDSLCTACHSAAPGNAATLHAQTASGNVFLYNFEQPRIYNATLTTEYASTPDSKTACFPASLVQSITAQGLHLCAEKFGLDPQDMLYNEATNDYSGGRVTSYQGNDAAMTMTADLPANTSVDFPGPGTYNLLLDLDYHVNIPYTEQPYQIAITQVPSYEQMRGSYAQWTFSEGQSGGTLTAGSAVSAAAHLTLNGVNQGSGNISGQVVGTVNVLAGFSSSMMRFRDDTAGTRGSLTFADEAFSLSKDLLDVFEDFTITARIGLLSTAAQVLPDASEVMLIASKMGSKSPYHGWGFGITGVAGNPLQFRLVFLSSCSSGFATQAPAAVRSQAISLPSPVLANGTGFHTVALVLERSIPSNLVKVKFYVNGVLKGYQNATDTGLLMAPPLNSVSLSIGGPPVPFTVAAGTTDEVTFTNLHAGLDAMQFWHHAIDFSLAPPMLP